MDSIAFCVDGLDRNVAISVRNFVSSGIQILVCELSKNLSSVVPERKVPMIKTGKTSSLWLRLITRIFVRPNIMSLNRVLNVSNTFMLLFDSLVHTILLL